MANKTEEARVEVILNGQKANATLNEMRAAARALGAELGKIPDPLNNADYAAAKKKLDDLKGKIGEVTGKANESGNSFQNIVKEITGFGTGMITGTAVAYGAFEGIKNIINSTWGSATTLRGTIEGLKAGFDSLFISINTGDWSNIFTNFQTASRLAKDLVEQEEKLNLMILTNSLKNSKLRAEATSLYQDIYTATSKEDKLTAIQKYLDLMHEVMDNDIKVAKQQELTANTAFNQATVHIQLKAKEALEIANMNADEREYYKFYNQNLEKLNQAELNLKDARTKRNETRESQLEVEVAGYKKLTTAAEQTTGFHKELAKKVSEFYKIGGKIDEATGIPKVISGLMGAEKNISDIENEYNMSTRRMLKQKATVTNEIAGIDDKSQKELVHKAETYSKFLLDIRKKLEESLIQLIQDEREKELKMVELDLVRDLDKIKGNSQQENDLRASLIDLANQQADKINQKYDKKKIEDSLKTEKEKWEAIVKADIDGSAKWFADSKTLLDKMKEIELSNANLTEQQIKDIEEKYRQLKKTLDNKAETDKWTEKIKADKIGSTQWLIDSQAWLKEQEDAELANTELTEKDRQAIILKYALKNQELLNQAESGTMSSRSGADQFGDLDMAGKRKLLEAQRDAELKIDKEISIAKKKSAKDAADSQEKIWGDFYKSLGKERAKELKSLLEMAQVAIGALSSIFNAQNEIENQGLQKDEDANNKKKDNLKKQLDSKKITQKQYDDAIAKMDEEADAKKRKVAHDQAVRQKELAIFNATIALLQAIIQASNIAPPADIVMPIIVAAMDAIQLAVLIATPVPAAAKGKYDVIGQDDGKTYSADWGGKPKTGIYDKPTLISEEGPELIIDAKTTKNLQENFPEVLEIIEKARVPQSADGKYNVIGQDDGKTYSAEWSGKPKTGIYEKPTLISEEGPILIIDARTTKNLQENFPEVLNIIERVKIRESAKGKYEVIDQDDERSSEINYINPSKKGILAKPTLISEAGPELVVDAPTIKNLQMNFPWILNAINFARVPQFTGGNYPSSSKSSISSDKIIYLKDPELLAALKEFNKNSKIKTPAYLSYDHLMEEIGKVDQIKKDASKTN